MAGGGFRSPRPGLPTFSNPRARTTRNLGSLAFFLFSRRYYSIIYQQVACRPFVIYCSRKKRKEKKMLIPLPPPALLFFSVFLGQETRVWLRNWVKGKRRFFIYPFPSFPLPFTFLHPSLALSLVVFFALHASLAPRMPILILCSYSFTFLPLSSNPLSLFQILRGGTAMHLSEWTNNITGRRGFSGILFFFFLLHMIEMGEFGAVVMDICALNLHKSILPVLGGQGGNPPAFPSMCNPISTHDMVCPHNTSLGKGGERD